MIERLISLLAPHYCSHCLKSGAVFCEHCMNNIEFSPLSYCVKCGHVLNNQDCSKCDLPYSYIDSYIEREGPIKQLIEDFKFNGARSGVKPLVKILDSHMPYFPGETIITYVPTARAHVRQRGYDHTKLMAKSLAKNRKIKVQGLLSRKRTAKQVGADRKTRLQQAKDLYFATNKLDVETTYVLIDDVITTGATIRYASQALWDAGARKIAVITVAHTSRS